MAKVIQDQGGRPYQEDTFFIRPDIAPGIHAYGIFDGHGGDYVSKELAQQMPLAIQHYLGITSKIDDVLFYAFRTCTEGLSQEKAMMCGSTAVVAIVTPSTVYVANCGDSRAIAGVRSGLDAALAVALTQDHKPADERERIEAAGGFVTPGSAQDVPRVNGNLAVSRSLGDFYLYPAVIWKPEISMMQRLPDLQDILLATDGVWDVMSNQEALDMANISGFNAMIELCRHRGSQDNITILRIPLARA